jgi:hypothetical protein
MQQNDLLNQSQLSGLSAGNTLFQQGMQGAQFGNQAQQQLLNNLLANANLGNQAQQQQFNQALTQYNMPLNTLSALRTGAQVQNPSFVNSAQQATTAGPDLLGAAGMQYNAQMGDFNARQAAQSNLNQGLFGLAGAGLMGYR